MWFAGLRGGVAFAIASVSLHRLDFPQRCGGLSSSLGTTNSTEGCIGYEAVDNDSTAIMQVGVVIYSFIEDPAHNKLNFSPSDSLVIPSELRILRTVAWDTRPWTTTRPRLCRWGQRCRLLPLTAATRLEHRGPQCLPILTRSTSPP